MQGKIAKFLKIFIAELEDLDEDIKILIIKCEEQHEHDEISQYVFLENLAVLQNELFGVEGFIEEVRTIKKEEFNSLFELKEYLLNNLSLRIKEKGLVHSIMPLVERKLNKVEFYLEHQDVN